MYLIGLELLNSAVADEDEDEVQAILAVAAMLKVIISQGIFTCLVHVRFCFLFFSQVLLTALTYPKYAKWSFLGWSDYIVWHISRSLSAV